jgi:hypothetical protein
MSKHEQHKNSDDWARPRKLDKLTVAFGSGAMSLLPPEDSIPDEFKHFNGTPWNRMVSRWFYSGLKGLKVTPREGIDVDDALDCLRCVIGSFEPKHGHKEAGAAYLCSLWFKDAQWDGGAAGVAPSEGGVA